MKIEDVKYLQNIKWDMDISLTKLIILNPTCIYERNPEERRASHGGWIYLKHPTSNDKYSICISMMSDGLVYYSDGECYDNSLNPEDTLSVLDEIVAYKKYIDIKIENLNKYDNN